MTDKDKKEETPMEAREINDDLVELTFINDEGVKVTNIINRKPKMSYLDFKRRVLARKEKRKN
jgi:phenolic acid decarboxylase